MTTPESTTFCIAIFSTGTAISRNPTSFLIDAQAKFVKVYQGPLSPQSIEDDFKRIPQTTEQRLALALPFPGNAETYEFGRNNLSLGSAFFQARLLRSGRWLPSISLFATIHPARKLNTASAACI